jgi:hypothetical protein
MVDRRDEGARGRGYSLAGRSGASATLVALLLIACGAEDPQVEEVGTQTAALSNDFGANTPWVTVDGVEGADTRSTFMGLRTGSGAASEANNIVKYTHAISSPWSIVGGTTERSNSRSVNWWENPFQAWATVYVDSFDGIMRDNARPTQNLFPSAGSMLPGPPSGMISNVTGDRYSIYARFPDNHIRKSYISGSLWSDIDLNVSQTFTPTGNPQVIHRSSNSDGVWYACGAATPARVCEYRIGGPAGSQTFNLSFGASTTFMDGTRPIAFADPNVWGRWVFGVTVNGSTRAVVAARETSPVDNGITQPTYQLYTIESTTSNVQYSSVMPYVHTDGTLRVVYFRTASGSNTVIKSTTWAGSFVNSWGGISTIHDVGRVIPLGNEPVPHVSTRVTPNRNTILYRLPPSGSASVIETVQLEDQATGSVASYAKTFLPSPIDLSNLYALQSGNLWQADDVNGARTQLGATSWSGVTSFASDRIGLGYAIRNSALWEINLDDGTFRQLGTQSWGGATEMAYGYEEDAARTPRLWVIQGDWLWKVDLATGVGTQLGSWAAWAGATSMAYRRFLNNENLFIVQNNSLYRADTNTGAWTQLGPLNAWAGETSMAADSMGGLYIYQASANGIYSVNMSSGAWTLIGSNSYPNGTALAATNNLVYFTQNSRLYKVTPTTGTFSQLGSAVWGSVAAMAPRDRNTQHQP